MGRYQLVIESGMFFLLNTSTGEVAKATQDKDAGELVWTKTIDGIPREGGTFEFDI